MSTGRKKNSKECKLCLVTVYSVDIKLLERELKTLIERNGIISKEICGNKHSYMHYLAFQQCML